MGSIPYHRPNPAARHRFSALRRAVLGSIRGLSFAGGALPRFSALRRAVLGSMTPWPVDPPAPKGFSALRRAVLGSIAFGRGQKTVRQAFQCSPTSRVGVNCPPAPRGRAGGQFQCSPTSRVGVNVLALSRGQTRTKFQCSPTSRVGVNAIRCSDRNRTELGFSALRRAVLGSIFGDWRIWSRWRGFSALRRAVLGSINRSMSIWLTLPSFQCSPTSRVGVNPDTRTTPPTNR